jgi:hypothetical protein
LNGGLKIEPVVEVTSSEHEGGKDRGVEVEVESLVVLVTKLHWGVRHGIGSLLGLDGGT